MNTMSMPTSHPPSRLAARIAISAVFFFNGMGFASWVTRIPAVRHALGLSEGQLGAALFALIAALSCHLRAPAADSAGA